MPNLRWAKKVGYAPEGTGGNPTYEF